jgi:hypothetical protein
MTDLTCARKFDFYSFDLRRTRLKACCKTEPFESPADLQNDLASIIDDRLKMAQGKRPNSCSECWRNEAQGFESYRREKPYHPSQDMSLDQHSPWLVEFVLPNTCNLKCVYCGPEFSSKWAARSEAAVVAEYRLDETIRRLVESWWPSIGLFNFVGGEPALLPELHEVLDFLDRTERLQPSAARKRISIVTNLAVPEKRFKDFLLRLQERSGRFDIEIVVSAEALGSRYEFIRDGASFVDFERAFSALLQSPGLRVSIIPSLNVLAMARFHEFLIYVLGRLRESGRNVHFFFNEVLQPGPLSARLFPHGLGAEKEKALRALAEFPRQMLRAPHEFDLFVAKLADVYDSAALVDRREDIAKFLDQRHSGRLKPQPWRGLFPELVVD